MQRTRLVPLCLAGFCADALTTWYGITHHVLREVNPGTNRFIVSLGLVRATLAITAIKVVIVGLVLVFETAARTAKDAERLRKVTNISLVALLFVGWVPAISNSLLMVKGGTA